MVVEVASRWPARGLEVDGAKKTGRDMLFFEQVGKDGSSADDSV